MAIHVRRREFIFALAGAAAAWPLTVHAQQPAMPAVVGFLNSASPDMFADRLRRFRQGLKETSHVEGGLGSGTSHSQEEAIR
jgi:putative tryptophan/tyrosine transport system substrate-binding protein